MNIFQYGKERMEEYESNLEHLIQYAETSIVKADEPDESVVTKKGNAKMKAISICTEACTGFNQN